MNNFPSSIYKEKTVKRLTENIVLTDIQKEYASRWIKKIEKGELKGETDQYLTFANIVLDKILGYEIDKIIHNKNNVEYQYADSSGRKVLCIEAKGTKTKSLFDRQARLNKAHRTPIDQTWDYMRTGDLDWGICTNYKFFALLKRNEKGKGYLFDFEEIKKHPEKLKEFVGVFSRKNLVEDKFGNTLYSESIVEERDFTKEFYKLFHETRLMLIKAFQNKENVSKERAIYFTQIFLNRLIFIFFVEDRGYLSDSKLFSNRILKLLESSQSTEHSRKVYDEISELFIAFDKGSPQLGVFGFNGGLFSGVIPHNIHFSDLRDPSFFSDVRQNSKLSKTTKLNKTASEIVNKYQNKLNPIISNLLILDSFDFTNEVNVEVLGHIFEQSISDLEELKNSDISRRKKEGVFYTPEYITDYICRNTIIPYLSKSNSSTIHELIQEYVDDIDDLETKFKEIKILDPACGSGAFLVKSIDILLEIYKEIQLVKESSGKYSSNSQLQMTKWNEETEIRSIVENNIYGLDINQESVEITQLSLFLKLASNDRKLIGLSKNILVGNTIVSDKNMDQRAFDWNKFPTIFYDPKLKKIENELKLKQKMIDGFDIILGNPPYVRQERLTPLKPYLKNNYQSFDSSADLYVYFLEISLRNLKDNGKMGMIVSNKWVKATYGENLRKFLSQFTIQKFIDFGDLPVFPDASTYPCIIIIEKTHSENNEILVSKIDSLEFSRLESKIDNLEFSLNQSDLNEGIWDFERPEITQIYNKIKSGGISLKKYSDAKINRGLLTGLNEVFILNKEKKKKLEENSRSSKDLIKPYLTGQEIRRYSINWNNDYILLIKKGTKIKQYPAILDYVTPYRQELEKRWDKGDWFSLRPCKFYDDFEKPKIIYAQFSKRPEFTYDKDNYYVSQNAFIISTDDMYLVAILNSNAIAFYSHSICPFIKGEFYQYSPQFVNQFPIPKSSNSMQNKMTNLVNDILKLEKNLVDIQNTILNRVLQQFDLIKLPTKFHEFYKFETNDFIKEIKKLTKSEIGLTKLDEWEIYFNKHQKNYCDILLEVKKIDDKINEMVYELFKITDSEKEIIENSIPKSYI